ncbi:MAG TPA: hypothetical protein VFG33_24675 [Kribbella sp.]|uniref:hypothetical protein n=1 Tax=Kribbella sp. TaxID=1871183 RepID=UPI002D7A2F93|nr:hypothetical protein [Kribbella sp.]HET6296604.1 hypothetical protein [Kribbella sp.]
MVALSVYCSGSIMKGAADEKRLCWTDDERSEVRAGASPRQVVFLNPDDPITDPGNTLGQFGRDMYQVMVASAVIVDARERRGLGIGVEMAAAATFGTPIIVVAPRNSKYRTDLLEYRGVSVKNYVHPHVASLSDHVVDDFMSAGTALADLRDSTGLRSDAMPAWLKAAIDEYSENVLLKDRHMLDALNDLGLDPKTISVG